MSILIDEVDVGFHIGIEITGAEKDIFEFLSIECSS